MALTVAFIGTGKRRERGSVMGYAMAYTHAEAFSKIEDVELVAACDIVEENVRPFAEQFGIERVFSDYHEMLAQVKPTAVSISTWPHLHEQMVIDCAHAGVKLIYCEKPMADTIGGARRMVEVCDETGTMLCFNHQRRYGKPFSLAKQMLDEGAIGELQRIEWDGPNIYDYGSHNFDMAQYFNDEVWPAWVMAQINYHTQELWFGAHNENDAVALIAYENGVFGLVATGAAQGLIGAHNRLVGSGGVIEIGSQAEGAGPLRYRTDRDAEWVNVDTQGEGLHGQVFIERAIADAVAAWRGGRRCMMDAHNAIKGTEAIFACWESSRQRARIQVPMEAEDNPLQEMVEAGQLKPAPPKEDRC
ncbi:MAG: Gfo/Idh/MocA family protein [Armatimonadota bacterium]